MSKPRKIWDRWNNIIVVEWLSKREVKPWNNIIVIDDFILDGEISQRMEGKKRFYLFFVGITKMKT